MWNPGTRFPAPRYPIPAGPHRVEQTIRRSRFITTLAPAPTPEAAHAFIDAIRTEFPYHRGADGR